MTTSIITSLDERNSPGHDIMIECFKQKHYVGNERVGALKWLKIVASLNNILTFTEKM